MQWHFQPVITDRRRYTRIALEDRNTQHTHMRKCCDMTNTLKKVKVCFYIAQYPVRWTTQTALHFSHGRPVQFRHQLDFSGKHPSHAAITHEDYPFTFPPLSIARYLFIQSLGRRGQNENGQVLLKLEYLFTDYDTSDFVVRQYTPILRSHLEEIHGHVCFANGICPQSS